MADLLGVFKFHEARLPFCVFSFCLSIGLAARAPRWAAPLPACARRQFAPQLAARDTPPPVLRPTAPQVGVVGTVVPLTITSSCHIHVRRGLAGGRLLQRLRCHVKPAAAAGCCAAGRASELQPQRAGMQAVKPVQTPPTLPLLPPLPQVKVAGKTAVEVFPGPAKETEAQRAQAAREQPPTRAAAGLVGLWVRPRVPPRQHQCCQSPPGRCAWPPRRLPAARAAPPALQPTARRGARWA